MDNLQIDNIDVILDPYRSGEVIVMLAEFKLTIKQYLEELIKSPVRSLADIIAFNNNNPDLVSSFYDHALPKKSNRQKNLAHCRTWLYQFTTSFGP